MRPQEIGLVRGARTAAGLIDLPIEAGRIAAEEPGGPSGSATSSVLDADGAAVVPAFVDAHVHLDKAHLLGVGEPAGSGLAGAILAMQEVRRTQPAAVVDAGARRGVGSLISHGVVAARAHVEIDPVVALDLLDLHLALREEHADQIDLQLSAFPQNGIDRRVAALMATALERGCEVVGGCPYADTDQAAHLDVVFDLAERYGRPVDLHLDFDDDPSGSMIAAVAERTRAHGMQGRVTVGHVTKLAAMPSDQQARALALLAEAGIALVVMPTTDLYLGGGREPGTRSLAPIERAAELGVLVAISNNNLHNAFSPYGNGSLLTAAWTAGLTRRLTGAEARRLLLATITANPARILGRSPHGTVPGDAADLVVLDADDPDDVVLRDPAVLASLRGGRLVHHRRELRVRALEPTA
jgi:cytosine deaminase